MIALTGGFPPNELFPYASIRCTLQDGTEVELDNPMQVLQVKRHACMLLRMP